MYPALGRLSQEDLKFEASLGYIVRLRPGWDYMQDPASKKFKKRVGKQKGS
jgi:hypothetical protein